MKSKIQEIIYPNFSPALPPRKKKNHELEGEHIVLKAKQEILLECGQSSLLLREDGTIVLKGVKIISRASKTHKVRGAVVKIN